MLNVFALELGVVLIVDLVLLAVKVFAFVNSLTWSGQHYTAANKLTKPAWTIILGLGLVLQLLMLRSSPINLLSLAFTIAAFVYLADVRPALASLSRRR
ncbi:DUF2516 family protein [Nocardioides panaciterrulae]|uniref:DUF2516 family protein n=1 Tax=Nocardioides panaciterrulae TaxID=661492 RepID=A0A7Y9JAQ9_9ACTN|nr:hypothetical protein [Nocardioides panaciterrulae]